MSFAPDKSPCINPRLQPDGDGIICGGRIETARNSKSYFFLKREWAVLLRRQREKMTPPTRRRCCRTSCGLTTQCSSQHRTHANVIPRGTQDILLFSGCLVRLNLRVARKARAKAAFGQSPCLPCPTEVGKVGHTDNIARILEEGLSDHSMARFRL